MKDMFRGYYQLTSEEFQQVWNSCIFVFDTNTLLHLYRYPIEAKTDLLTFLEKHKERVWIPFQVALEFQENRLAVIADQVHRFSQVKKIVEKGINSISSELEKLQLQKRHSLIDPNEFIQKLEQSAEEFLSELQPLESNQIDVTDDDKIRARLDAIFDGRVGPPPSHQDELNEIYSEGEKRYALQIPPGYVDLTKKKRVTTDKASYSFGGLEYKRKYGDLILWKQLIKHACDNDNIKNIIFVTDDGTEDWWWIVNSQGEKLIGPRPELLREMVEEGKLEQFYLYRPEQFLIYANKYLKAEVKQESIQQVRDVSTLVEFDAMNDIPYLAEMAVVEWLKQQFKHQLKSATFPNYIRHTNAAKRIGYVIRYTQDIESAIFRIEKDIDRNKLRLNATKLSRLEYIFACIDKTTATKLKNWIKKGKVQSIHGARFTIGYLEVDTHSEEFNFVPV